MKGDPAGDCGTFAMKNEIIGKTARRLCEVCVFAGAAVTCISCLFGKDVFTFFNNISAVTAFILLIPLFLILRRELLKDRIAVWVIIGFSAVSIIFSLFVSGLHFSYSLTAIVGLLTLFIMSRIPVGRDFQLGLILFLSIMSICLLFLAVGFSQMTLVEKYNYTNSNVMGIVALFVNAYLMIMINMNRAKGRFIHLNIIVAVFGFTTITVFGCRSAQLAFLVFIVITYLFPSRFWGKKRTRTALIAAMVIGLIFPFIYVKMSRIGFDDIAFPLVNKPWFSGRDVLWEQGINWIKESPFSLLFGVGPNYSDITAEFNYHNSYLSVLMNFGIPAFAAYYFSVERSAEASVLCTDDRRVRSMQMALICMVLVVSLVETTIPATTFIWLYGMCFIPLGGQKSG